MSNQPEDQPEEYVKVVVICPRCKGSHHAYYQDKNLTSYVIVNGAKECKPCETLERLAHERYA